VVKVDLHVHTHYSIDAGLSPREVVRVALKRGLGGVAVTDHGTVRGGLAVREASPPGFIAIPGVEVNTYVGHLLVLFVDEEESWPSDPFEVVERASRLGGLVILAHPFDSIRGGERGKVWKVARAVDAVEALNSRSLSMKSALEAERLAREVGKPITAGSDAHFSLELGRAYLNVEASGGEDVREALIKRRCKVEGGLSPPYVHLMSSIVKGARKLNYLLAKRSSATYRPC